MEKSEKKITIKDIAQLVGVSIRTVDRLIHNRGEVSSKTKEKILKITKTLNYQPDILASALASKKNISIGILMPASSSESTFWKAPNIGVDKALNELEHFGVKNSKYLYNISDKNSFFIKAKEALKRNHDVLLIAPAFHKEAYEIANLCSEKHIPYAFFNSNLPNLNQICYVGQDATQSGIVAAKLMDYGLKGSSEILIVSLLGQLKNNNHILSRKQGFIQYFKNKGNNDIQITSLDIDSIDVGNLYDELRKTFISNPGIKGIFVTNSRVFHIARFIEAEKLNHINLIGYDLTEENIPYLEKEIIRFLITQKPVEQAYRAIHTVFNKIVLKKEVPKEILLPIDIVTKENLMYYE